MPYTYAYRGHVIMRGRDDFGRVGFVVLRGECATPADSILPYESLREALDGLDRRIGMAEFRATVEEWSA